MKRMVTNLLKLRLKSILFALGLMVSTHAYSVSCVPRNNAPYIYNYDTDFDSKENYVGYSTNWISLNRGGTYTLPSPCSGKLGPVYFTLLPENSLILAGNSDKMTYWYDIPENDYLQVAMQVYIGGNRGTYEPIPTNAISNQCNKCGPEWASGGKIKVKLRVKKKFVGQSFVVSRYIGLIYAATSARDKPTVPISLIQLNATMTVPQSCTFDVGSVIEFDFGKIPSSGFSNVGVGNKPAGVNPMIKTIGIECKNIDAQQMLSARIEAINPSGNMIRSDNKDVGFLIADKNDRVLVPNNSSSYIPFKLDQNARSSFVLKAWPVSLTGVKPNAGPLSSQGHVRIDFQ